MEIVASLCFVIAAVLTAIYLHALAKLHGILRNERPELVEHRGSLSFFYTGMPRIADPNVGVATLKVAFSRNLPELQRSEEHTSELQSLMRISYAVFCLKKKIKNNNKQLNHTIKHQNSTCIIPRNTLHTTTIKYK